LSFTREVPLNNWDLCFPWLWVNISNCLERSSQDSLDLFQWNLEEKVLWLHSFLLVYFYFLISCLSMEWGNIRSCSDCFDSSRTKIPTLQFQKEGKGNNNKQEQMKNANESKFQSKDIRSCHEEKSRQCPWLHMSSRRRSTPSLDTEGY